jgi:hypothetical protein
MRNSGPDTLIDAHSLAQRGRCRASIPESRDTDLNLPDGQYELALLTLLRFDFANESRSFPGATANGAPSRAAGPRAHRTWLKT